MTSFTSPTTIHSPSLRRVLISQTQVAFTDSVCKFLLIDLAQRILLDPDMKASVANLLPILLPIPFILFSPLAGWLADRFSKRDVIGWTLVAQLAAILVLILGMVLRSLPITFFAFFFLSVQATFISPAKLGILKELVPVERLGWAVGILEMLVMVAILVGGYFGGEFIGLCMKVSATTSGSGNGIFQNLIQCLSNPWNGGLVGTLILTIGCVITLVFFLGTEKTPAISDQPFHFSLFWQQFIDLDFLLRQAPLRLPALGVAYFYSFGGYMLLLLVEVGREIHPSGAGAAALSSILLLCLGMGTATGSMFASQLCKHGINHRIIPLGAWGMVVMLGILAFIPSSVYLWLFALVLTLAGFIGTLFYVPLAALVQERAGNDSRGRIQGGTNILVNIGQLVVIGSFYVFNVFWGMSSGPLILCAVASALVIALYTMGNMKSLAEHAH